MMVFSLSLLDISEEKRNWESSEKLNLNKNSTYLEEEKKDQQKDLENEIQAQKDQSPHLDKQIISSLMRKEIK